MVLTVVQVLCVALILVGAYSVQAQDDGVMDCIGETSDVTFSAYGWGTERALSPAEAGRLDLITGEDMWLGYELGGYEVPEDTKKLFTLRGDGPDGPMEVWVYGAESDPDAVYWFSFSDTTLFASANGEHYGQHPCGIFRADRWRVLQWLIKLAGRGD